MKVFNNRLNTGYLLITLLFVFLLVISGYFQIGLISDDYVNYYSANVSSVLEKFSSNVIYYNHLLLRPMWFLSLSLDIFIKKSLSLPADNYFVFRIHNLILYLLFAFTVSYIFHHRTRNESLTLLLYVLILVFPNNFHSLLWIVCRNDIQFGILGFLCMLFMFMYYENSSYSLLLLSSLTLFGSLFYKETAIVFPFVILIAMYYFYEEKSKRKIKFHIFNLIILFIYIIYKLFFLNSSAGSILNNYSVSTMDRISVIPKALLTVFNTTDYLTLNYCIQEWNPVCLMVPFAVLFLILTVLYITYKERPKKPVILFLLFILLIIPNVIAGYFRPQLIIVPFSVLLLFLMFDISSLKNKGPLLVKSIMIILVLIFTAGSYSRIKDYEYSYEKLKSNINTISGNLNSQSKNTVILFLPSRFKQSYVLDNVTASYNYFKYNDFIIKDTIQGFVSYAALDVESLNSEITIQSIDDVSLIASCTGKTQFFYNIDNNSISDFENDYIRCEFQKDIMFLNKCKKVKLILKDITKFRYLALTKDKLVNINSR